MTKIKVAQFAISAGGVKKHIVDLVTGIDRGRFEIIGIFPDLTLWGVEIQDQELKYSAIFSKLGFNYYILEIPRNLSVKADIAGLFGLIKILKREKPDVLHCHSSLAGFIGRLAAFICRTPMVVYTPHLMYFKWSTGVKRIFYLFAERILQFFADKIIMVSRSEYLGTAPFFSMTDKFVVIPNGVAINDLDADRGAPVQAKSLESLNAAPAKLIILTITRLSPQKDIWTLLKAIEQIPDDVPPFVLLIAGDGEEADACREYIAAHNLADRIELLGWRDDVFDLLAASDIVAFSSRNEGMAYTVLEASAMGKPQVASDVQGVKDAVVHGETGFLFEAGDDAAMAKLIEALLRNPDLRHKMGQNARNYIRKNFSIEQMIGKTETLYLGL